MGLLRILLALSVVMVHNGNLFFRANPVLAVPAFFIISGFVIALVLNEKYVGNVKGFFIARYLRLWPSYIVVLAIILVFFFTIHPIPNSPIANLHLFGVSFGLMFYDTLGWVGYNDTLNTMVLMDGTKNGAPLSMVWRTPMPHMWSVGAEMTFYLVAPLLARRWKALLAVFAAAYIVHVLIVLNLPIGHPLRAKSTINSFYLFVAGMLAYWGWVYAREWLSAVKVHAIPLAVFAFAFVAWVGFQAFKLHPLLPDAVLLIFAAAIIPVFHFSQGMKADRYIGELSYATYLVHYPLMQFVFDGHSREWLWTFYIAATSVACAWLLQVLVVVPVDQLRRRVVRRPVYSLSRASVSGVRS